MHPLKHALPSPPFSASIIREAGSRADFGGGGGGVQACSPSWLQPNHEVRPAVTTQAKAWERAYGLDHVDKIARRLELGLEHCIHLERAIWFGWVPAGGGGGVFCPHWPVMS